MPARRSSRRGAPAVDIGERLQNTLASVLGRDIRGLRKVQGMTITELAAKAGITQGFLSQIEHGAKRPSIGTLQRLAEGLECDTGWFLQEAGGEADPEERRFVVRAARRRRLSYTPVSSTDYLGYTDFLLSANLDGGVALVMTTLVPGGTSGDEIYTHDGEEAGFLASGQVTLTIEDRDYVLEKGDSYSFPSRLPHKYFNHGRRDAVIVMAIAPVSVRY